MTAQDASTSLRAFKAVLRMFCVVPFLTGIVDVVGGTWIIEQAGARLPADVSHDPVLNNQIAFWGAIWFGYGVCLWRVSADPLGRFQATRLLLAVLLLAGLARAYGAIRWGHPGPVMAGAMAIELALSPVLLLWINRLKTIRGA